MTARAFIYNLLMGAFVVNVVYVVSVALGIHEEVAALREATKCGPSKGAP